jgi:hypothetical protein
MYGDRFFGDKAMASGHDGSAGVFGSNEQFVCVIPLLLLGDFMEIPNQVGSYFFSFVSIDWRG